MGRLDGRYAVVTGGARGIGRKIVERFIAEGVAGIAVFDFNAELVREAKKRYEAEKNIVFYECDVSKEDMIEATFKQVYNTFGRIDILVNNAGITRDAMLHKMTIEQFDTVMDVNIRGVYLCMKQVISAMREQNYGKIVNISSTSAYGNIGQANYAASKAGVLGLTATAAMELGRKNITVNAVLPGVIETDMIRTVPESMLEIWKSNIPLGRFGSPEELAATVLFLSSDDSSYISGCSIVCAGGMTVTY